MQHNKFYMEKICKKKTQFFLFKPRENLLKIVWSGILGKRFGWA